jgi:Flp pilus assembly protein TadD
MRNTRYLFITLFLFHMSVLALAAEAGDSSLITEGRELLAKGQYDAAEAKFREAAKKDSDPEAWL